MVVKMAGAASLTKFCQGAQQHTLNTPIGKQVTVLDWSSEGLGRVVRMGCMFGCGIRWEVEQNILMLMHVLGFGCLILAATLIVFAARLEGVEM